MGFEKISNEINYDELIGHAFGGDDGLKAKIKEVMRNKDLELYTTDFARAVADSGGLDEDFPLIKLMIKIYKVFPPELPLDERRFLGESAPKSENSRKSLFKDEKKAIKDAELKQLREQKRSGDDDPEDYIHR